MSPSARTSTRPRSKLQRQVDAVMDAAPALVAIVAQSIAEADVSVTLPQLRVLVMVERHGPLNLTAVAHGLGVHPSNATRTCTRLVEAGLLARGEDADDRRNLVLTLTRDGDRLVESVMQHRREAIEHLLRRMPPQRREHLAAALQEFADAAGATPDEQAAAFGWIH